MEDALIIRKTLAQCVPRTISEIVPTRKKFFSEGSCKPNSSRIVYKYIFILRLKDGVRSE
ncbi:hypothetical protein BM613_05035 [Sulfoacidibacillus thermotolerans]|uniref:Uncharacterized protein n=1 Tax=Sulfoacidibacillus thermotolerans TaxID=1765684 RepID=A0A2U3D9U1_SULT2|nr:hypothetical protein BM613_05035 [Sulfoacidibacillus thermotolerans]